MMQQKRNKKLLCAILTVALTLATLAGTLLSVFADGYELTVNFPEEVEKVTYIVRLGDRNVALGTLEESGTPFVGVPFEGEIIVRVTPKAGYTVDSVKDASNNEVTFSSRPDEDTKVPYFEFTEHGVTSDRSYTVTCTNREFKVDFKPSAFALAGMTVADYTVPDTYDYDGDGETTENLDLQKILYTYKSGASVIKLANAVKSGYKFEYWEARGNEGESYRLTNGELPNTYTNSKAIETGTLSLHAVFTKYPYTVTRKDYAFDINADNHRGEQLGIYAWRSEVATEINAQTDGGTAASGDPGADGYVGYRLCDALQDAEVFDLCRLEIYKTVVNDTSNPEANVVYRYYKPIVYTLKYVLFGGEMTGAVTNHTYNRETALPTPTRDGYTFKGWRVIVDDADKGVVTSLAACNEDYAAEAADRTIVLEAQWEANEYDIAYDLDGGTAGENAPQKHVYDSTTTIPAPTKTGYHFKGWFINGTDRVTAPGELGAKELPAEGSNTIRLKAKWEPKKFEVLLDANLGEYPEDAVRNLAERLIGTYSFGMAMDGINSGIPMRTGYTFSGFYTEPEGGVRLIDGQGDGVVGAFWSLDDADDDGFVTLYARWTPNSYNIKLNYDRELVSSVAIDGVPYTGTHFQDGVISVLFRVPVELNIRVKDGYKVTTVGGKTVPHMTNFVYGYRHETANEEYTLDVWVEVLPALPTPVMTLDYPTETLRPVGKLPAGIYSLLIGGELWSDFEVDSEGVITIGGKTVEAIKLIESCFGNTLEVIRRGRAGFEADSDPLTFQIPARPAAPTIEYTAEVGQDRITVNVLTSNAAELEFSISASPLAPSAVWQSSSTFTTLADGSELQPGTTYYIFVRVKGTETTPGGLSILPPLAVRTEPVTDEIGLILPTVCLGITLLCQLVAIAFLLIRRAKAKKNATLCGFAPIWALAVRFDPVGLLPAVLVLAALVVIAQAFLIYLILTAKALRRPMPEREADEQGTADAVTSADADEYVYDEPSDEGADAYVSPDAVAEAPVEEFSFSEPNDARADADPDADFVFDYGDATAETVEEAPYEQPLADAEEAQAPVNPVYSDEYDEIDDSYLAQNESTPDDSDDIDDSQE